MINRSGGGGDGNAAAITWSWGGAREKNVGSDHRRGRGPWDRKSAALVPSHTRAAGQWTLMAQL
ncbi:hypothetical protein GCM10009574_078290 [Streptomyces asiaticus]|uniref:Uncharacterized protein n=2 Tax=Streptomyces rhizosphaericus TaxID=114699 RepID=A0ABP3ZHM8_9ACTN